MTKTTKAQRKSLYRKYVHGNLSDKNITYRQFRKTVQPTSGMDGAVVVQWCNMWLAIEGDGYVHS